MAVYSGACGPSSLLVVGCNRVTWRIGYQLLSLNDVMGISQVEILGKECCGEGDETCGSMRQLVILR